MLLKLKCLNLIVLLLLCAIAANAQTPATLRVLNKYKVDTSIRYKTAPKSISNIQEANRLNESFDYAYLIWQTDSIKLSDSVSVLRAYINYKATQAKNAIDSVAGLAAPVDTGVIATQYRVDTSVKNTRTWANGKFLMSVDSSIFATQYRVDTGVKNTRNFADGKFQPTLTAGNGIAITTNTVSISATGTPSSSTYLRGDYSWAAVSGGQTTTITAGSNITVTGTAPTYTISATGGGGVTSVAATVPTDFSISGSPITSTGTLAITHKSLNTITDAANFVFDGSNGNFQKITLGASRAFTITNLLVGVIYKFFVVQDGTGGRVLTWSTTVKAGWGYTTTPPISTAANAIDIYEMTTDGTNIFVDVQLGH